MVAVILNVLYALLLLQYSRGWKKALAGNPVSFSDEELPHVSVLIPVRNEAAHLTSLLNSLRNQNYPRDKTTWIFINDHSEDAGVEMLKEINDPRLKIIELTASGVHGKKAALTAGVMAAATEWILTTDADCMMEAGWIRALLSKAIESKAVMVCGLVKVQQDHSVLGAFQAMETAVLQCCGAGALVLGFPLLNTGASLAFKKSAWLQCNGYTSKQHIASGDDTFLMLSLNAAYPGKVVPAVHQQALVTTLPQKKLMHIVQQRLRWNGKVKHYPLGTIHLVGFVVMAASLSFNISLVQYFIDNNAWSVFLLCFALRLLVESFLLYQWKKISAQKFSLPEIIGMSFFYPLFTLFSLIIRPFLRNIWKGRQL